MALTVGLVAIKAGIVVALGPLVGLKRSESVRTGFVLSQGGEFAFVVFTLANQLQVRDVSMLARLYGKEMRMRGFPSTPLLSHPGASSTREAWHCQGSSAASWCLSCRPAGVWKLPCAVLVRMAAFLLL